MNMSNHYTLKSIGFVALAITGLPAQAQLNLQPNGRSAMYPATWLPVDDGGSLTASEKYLDDFSYAGYRGSELDAADRQIPANPGTVTINVAAPTGGDDTAAIQSGIDAACAGGGGVVSLQSGTYRVRPPGAEIYALNLWCDRLLLKGRVDGAGVPTTSIFNTSSSMRLKRVILVRPRSGNDWTSSAAENAAGSLRTTIAQSALLPTRELKVASSNGYRVGDWIAVRADVTNSFRSEHGMSANQNDCGSSGCWSSSTGLLGLMYYRRVTAVNPGGQSNTLGIDIPTRYYLKTGATGNNPRVFRLDWAENTNPNSIAAVGVENIRVGMAQTNLPGMGQNDYDTPGTGAYEVHNATAIRFERVRNGWVRNVRSYNPGNAGGKHLLSVGVAINQSRGVTLDKVILQDPQYRGAGGNGYLISISSQETLVINSSAYRGRHNFLVQQMIASGNVFSNNRSGFSTFGVNDGPAPSDYHGQLSHANLFERHTVEAEWLQSANRGDSSNGAGITGTQNVYWNITGLSYPPGGNRNFIVRSAQFAWGYVIGTRGAAGNAVNPASGAFADDAGTSANGTSVTNSVVTNAGDHLEGETEGSTLVPQSLFNDQLNKRRTR